MDVIIVGGGVYGLFIAYHLVNEGLKVTLIDHNEPGAWSKAAVGILEYNMFSANMINSMSYMMRYIKMLRNGETELRYINTRWLRIYLRSMTRRRDIFDKAINAVKNINNYSRKIYRAFAEEKNDFEYSEEPLYEIAKDIEKIIKEAKKDPLNPKYEIVEIMGRQAVAYHDVAKLSTDLFIKRLLKDLEKKIFFRKAFVWDVHKDAVYLDNGEILRGEKIIVSAGYWTSTLEIPIAPFKGYGLRIRSSFKLRNMIYSDEKGIFMAPFSRWIKISSRFDPDSGVETRPLRDIIRRSREILGDLEVIDISIGYRPCTPDGLPIIDRINEKIYVSTGGCRLGWTQAPGAAKITSDLVLERIRETPFKLNRFIQRSTYK